MDDQFRAKVILIYPGYGIKLEHGHVNSTTGGLRVRTPKRTRVDSLKLVRDLH